MKIKNKLLSIVTPVLTLGAISPVVGCLSSCSNTIEKKEEQKYPTTTIKMDRVQSLDDLNSEASPMCILNNDDQHTCLMAFAVPSSTTVKAFYQIGELDVDTNTITWPETWSSLSNKQLTIEYLHPLRFYAYNTEKPGQLNTHLNESDTNFEFRIAFTRLDGGDFEKGKGIRLAGSIRSLLGTKEISEGKLEALEDLNENSNYAFSGLFAGDLYSHSWSGLIYEISPGFLPFKTMAKGCYSCMFENNKNLLVGPDLPASAMSEYSYYRMFTDCKSLQVAPYLPAITLKENCYNAMFKGCSSLNSVSLGYVGNFLHSPEVELKEPIGYFDNWLNAAGTENSKIYYDGEDTERSGSAIPVNFNVVSRKTTDPSWLEKNTLPLEVKDDKDISDKQTSLITTGEKTKFRAYKSQTINDIVNQIPAHEPIDTTLEEYEGYYKKVEGNEPEKLEFKGTEQVTVLPSTVYVKYQKPKDIENPKVVNVVAEEDNVSIKLSKKASSSTIYYIKGTDAAKEMTSGETVILNQNEILKIYGDVYSTSSKNYTNFKITGGKAKLTGNVMSLLSTNPDEQPTSLTRDYCFANLFNGSTSITSVSEDFLPKTITTIRKGCYYQMFKDCANMTNCVALPASGSAPSYCYNGMFYGCESITTPADLPFSTLNGYCFTSMYQGCKKLTRPAIINNGNKPTERTGYNLDSTFQDCTGIKVTKDKTKGTLFFNCWDSSSGWGPVKIFYNTSGEYKGSSTNSIANTAYYYY